MADELSAYKIALDESAIVAITDHKGIITHVNDNFCEISKYSRDELIGQDHRIVNSGFHKKEFMRKLWRTIAQGKIWRGEICNRAKDGELYWVSTTIVPFLDIKGKPYQYVAIRSDITPRVRTEERLRESIKETRDYQFALDESAIVAITDQKGTITHANDNFCKISKYTRDELIGQDHRILNSGYHEKTFIRELWRTIAKGKIWKGELRNRAKDGSIYWVDTTIVPFLNQDGKPYQYLAIRSDITERKANEAKLLKANRLYAFLSSINQSIIHTSHAKELLDNACATATEIGSFKFAWAALMNKDGTLGVVSAFGDQNCIKELMRYSGEDFSKGKLKSSQAGRAIVSGRYSFSNNVLDDPDQNAWRTVYKRLGIASNISLPIFRFGKVVGVFHVDSDQKDYFDKEEVDLLVESAGDISFALENYAREDLRRWEENEKKSLNAQYKLLVENTSDLVGLHNPFGEFIYVSPSCKVILGYEQHELVGMDPYKLVHPDDRHLLDNTINQDVVHGPTCLVTELRIRHRDGQYKWLETRSIPLFNDSGKKVVQIHSTSRDITERKLSEEQIRKSQEFTAGVLNSLSAHIAVADSQGNILSVNEAWRQFGIQNGATSLDRTCEGSNYFEVCRRSHDFGDEWALVALNGMLKVLEGKDTTFYLEYPCHSPTEDRWFGMRVMRFESDDSMIVIAHENITNVKKAEQERDKTLSELEERVYQRTIELKTRNKNITDSIQYAKHIQAGLLPRHAELRGLFFKSFIMYEPSHIVSGDFFWCHTSRSRKIVAVVDCTGHGVPGALMSIVGNYLLHQIVVVERIENPSEILEQLDKRLLETTKKESFDVQDGMDVCLCIIDDYFKEIYFAGAMRPLFFTDCKGEVHELNGSRFEIGGHGITGSKYFETKRHSYKEGHRIYLTSDGYYSQFGGDKNRKFMKSRFKQTLAKIQNLPMPEQGVELLNILQNWKGTNDQVDDVLVVGIEL